VKSFAAQGARVGFVDLMAEAGAALAKELQNSGQTVMFQHCDITDTGQYQQAIRRFEEAHGPCLVLVNNAANDTRADWRQITAEEFNRRISINLAHAFFAIQAVAPGMMAARHGSIINFGSISWMAAQAGIPVYTAAKAATHGMTRSFARELGQYNIRVNTVVPGWVDQAPARPVGRRRRQRTDRPESVSRRESAAAGHRRDGDLPRLGRCAYVLGAELRCRWRLGLSDDR
jgi:NAD(P)-dependent dehydrogenase (short-subunit alcohol dehydrogenase family)